MNASLKQLWASGTLDPGSLPLESVARSVRLAAGDPVALVAGAADASGSSAAQGIINSLWPKRANRRSLSDLRPNGGFADAPSKPAPSAPVELTPAATAAIATLPEPAAGPVHEVMTGIKKRPLISAGVAGGLIYGVSRLLRK